MDELNDAIAHLGEWMRSEPVGTPLLLADTSSEIRWEAKGQVLVLAPWNYPVFLLLGPLVGAVAAGNTVILKPSEKVRRPTAPSVRSSPTPSPRTRWRWWRARLWWPRRCSPLPFDHLFFTGSTRVESW